MHFGSISIGGGSRAAATTNCMRPDGIERYGPQQDKIRVRSVRQTNIYAFFHGPACGDPHKNGVCASINAVIPFANWHCMPPGCHDAPIFARTCINGRSQLLHETMPRKVAHKNLTHPTHLNYIKELDWS
eukprot:6476218-Amphidinium_carterae.1